MSILSTDAVTARTPLLRGHFLWVTVLGRALGPSVCQTDCWWQLQLKRELQTGSGDHLHHIDQNTDQHEAVWPCPRSGTSG